MLRFDKTITLGHVITAGSVLVAVFVFAYGSPGDLIQVKARVTALEVANVEGDKRELRFQADVRQDLTDVKSDLRELRAEIRTAGVRWSELPPSRFKR
jgi:hypothetical protein